MRNSSIPVPYRFHKNKCRSWTCFYPWVFDWIEADRLNESLKSIVKKGRGLSGLMIGEVQHTSQVRSCGYDLLSKYYCTWSKKSKHKWMNQSQKED